MICFFVWSLFALCFSTIVNDSIPFHFVPIVCDLLLFLMVKEAFADDPEGTIQIAFYMPNVANWIYRPVKIVLDEHFPSLYLVDSLSEKKRRGENGVWETNVPRLALHADGFTFLFQKNVSRASKHLPWACKHASRCRPCSTLNAF